MNPVYRFDKVSGIHWLEFDGKPEQDTIDLLKKEGWRWSGYRKQWRTNRRFAKPPVGIDYEDGGECDYSAERPERLANAAVRASDRSEQAYERSNQLAPDQPVIINGTRAGKQLGKALEQSRSAMSQSVEEQKKADHLEYKARSSARHQAYKERPDVIARRIKRLKADIVSIRNQMKYEPYGLWSAKQQKDEAKIAEIKAAWEASNQEQEAKIAIIEQEIAENEEALQEAGGLVADNLDIQVGDIIRGRWQGLNEVVKINKKNGEILSYTCKPLENTWSSKYVIPKDQVRGLAVRKGDVTSEALLQAKFEEKLDTYTPEPAKEEKPEREFKAASVETIEVYRNDTSLFPTPTAISNQLAQDIPSNAYLILEPSAGTGSLAQAVTRELMGRGQNHMVHCCEILPQLRRSLSERGYQVVGENFLEYTVEFQYSVVIMNPPFANTEWVDHIEHALDLLQPGGTLLAILPQGFVFRQDKRIVAFREMVEECGTWQELPRDAFVESGTNMATVMISMRKPATEMVEEEAEPEFELEQLDLFAM